MSLKVLQKGAHYPGEIRISRNYTPSLPPHLYQTSCRVAEEDGGTREAKRRQPLEYDLLRVVCSVSIPREILT